MGGIVSQIASLTIVYSTVYSDANRRKYEISASLAFVRGIHRGPVNSPHKWPVMRKKIPFDDVIMVWFCVIWWFWMEEAHVSFVLRWAIEWQFPPWGGASCLRAPPLPDNMLMGKTADHTITKATYGPEELDRYTQVLASLEYFLWRVNSYTKQSRSLSSQSS